ASAKFLEDFEQNNRTTPEDFEWPFVPASRSFCFGVDVTQYNLSRCVIVQLTAKRRVITGKLSLSTHEDRFQNNVAYFYGKEPRHLSDEQIKRFEQYAKELEAYGIYLYENAMQKRGKTIRSRLTPVSAPQKPTSICDEIHAFTQ
ncbi:unnamed protein product, partial [Anisakis simplex]|uniref:Transposase n=1 Tax=Anisakis simplex TaxID=6269 RepID=A0A0M3KFA0_ANISI